MVTNAILYSGLTPASDVNFDTESDAFGNDFYLGDSWNNVPDTKIVYVGVSQPGEALYRHEPAVTRARHWRR